VIDRGTGFSAQAATSRCPYARNSITQSAASLSGKKVSLIVYRAGKIAPDSACCPSRVSPAVFNQPRIARRAEILRLVVASIMLMPVQRLQSSSDVVERNRAAVQRAASGVSAT